MCRLLPRVCPARIRCPIRQLTWAAWDPLSKSIVGKMSRGQTQPWSAVWSWSYIFLASLEARMLLRSIKVSVFPIKPLVTGQAWCLQVLDYVILPECNFGRVIQSLLLLTPLHPFYHSTPIIAHSWQYSTRFY